jgi:hypothetical protein
MKCPMGLPVSVRHPVSGPAPQSKQRNGRRRLGMVLALLLLAPAAGGMVIPAARAQAPTNTKKGPPDFQAEVRPLLQKYCLECHGSKQAEGDVALHRANSVESARQDRGTWEAALRMVELEAMPPDDARQPSPAERKQLAELLEKTLFYLDCEQQRDPGRVTIRRLNRTEYNNTVRDLLGVELRPADDFPSDDVGEGFDNIGDVLSLPPLLMEKYLDAAEQLASAAILDRDPTQLPRTTLQREQLQATGGVRSDDYGVYGLYSQGTVSGSFKFPRQGEYLLRVEAGAQQAGDEPAKIELRLDGKKVAVLDVTTSADKLQFYEHKAQVKQGAYRLDAIFINDFYNPGDPNPNNRDRNLYLRALEVVGPVDLRADDFPASHRRLVTARPGPKRTVGQAAQEVLTPLLQRAFRRKARPGEVQRYARLVELAVQQGDSFERGLQVALSGILVSPHFLFRVEQDTNPGDPRDGHPLTDFELASRLSYFLWSSMPDDELFRLASQNQLRRDDVLQREVARMLRDPKAEALVENFGGQWLNLRGLDGLTPDAAQFPEFNEALRQAMRRETELFFNSIMREDRSVLDFLRGDFTFVNEALARHYGLEGVQGPEFQRVTLDPQQRRGILTHASILTLTSNPTRTSPVKRGKWILENILGTPPPDPPPNVPELSKTQEAVPNASLRQQLEQHRRDPACAVCHRKMDALGFGLENFDAVGKWRQQDGRSPVDASGVLPGGDSFQGPVQLAELLASQKKAFARALTEKMLTYALGRGLEFYDRCTTDKIVEKLEQMDYHFSVLVTEIVKSESFRLRRGEGDES